MHLLVRETRGLDEAEEAVDLGQSSADLVFLSFSDSDLGARKVTIDVPPLRLHEIHAALAGGAALADELVGAGLIFGAVLVLQGRFARVGGVPPRLAAA